MTGMIGGGGGGGGGGSGGRRRAESQLTAQENSAAEGARQEERMTQPISNLLVPARASVGLKALDGGVVGDKRSMPDAPDPSHLDGCQGRNRVAGAAGPKWLAEMQRNKKLRKDGEARNLSREERKMMVIMRQIEEMEQKQKANNRAGAPGPRSTHLEGRVGHGSEKRRESDACDTSTLWNLVECQVCASTQDEERMILCDVCDGGRSTASVF